MPVEIQLDTLTGPDACALTSLEEYGIAWRKEPDGSYRFFYGVKIGCDENGLEVYARFDHCTIQLETLDLREEYNWIHEDEWPQIFPDCFEDGKQVEPIPLTPFTIEALVRWFGYEEIFGTCYWEGFKFNLGKTALV